LQSFLSSIQQLPNIRSLELASYEKELERYAPIGILAAERLFCLSTRLVLKTITNFDEERLIPVAEDGTKPDRFERVINDLLLNNGSEVTRLIVGILHLNEAFQAAGFELGEVINICKNICNQLFKNLNINKELKIIYDQDFRSISVALTRFFNKESTGKTHDQFFDVLAEKLCNLNQYNKSQVLIDLNHLHLNRLFPHEPNYHEAQCYYYLYKQLIRQFKTSQG
jgi:hypothetical protein